MLIPKTTIADLTYTSIIRIDDLVVCDFFCYRTPSLFSPMPYFNSVRNDLLGRTESATPLL